MAEELADSKPPLTGHNIKSHRLFSIHQDRHVSSKRLIDDETLGLVVLT